ncbi:MAG: hypothetical protein HYT93_01150 [Parcubacteria group bacterium]|nr:hypothetical protein [Parcubacteria group bacterium]
MSLKELLWAKPVPIKEILNLWEEVRYKKTEGEFKKLHITFRLYEVLCFLCLGYAAYALMLIVAGFIYIPFEKMPWWDVAFDGFQMFCAYRVMVYGINRTAEMLGYKKE